MPTTPSSRVRPLAWRRGEHHGGPLAPDGPAGNVVGGRQLELIQGGGNGQAHGGYQQHRSKPAPAVRRRRSRSRLGHVPRLLWFAVAACDSDPTPIARRPFLLGRRPSTNEMHPVVAAPV